MAARNKRVAIVQSNYIPWKGYFDLIARADEFVLYDDVQYTRRDWRNRNRVKSRDGIRWLTIPVGVKGRYDQRIRDVVVSDSGWADMHWRILTQDYARAACFREVAPLLEQLYDAAARIQHLSGINEMFIRGVCDFLGIRTPLRQSSEFALADGRSERLLDLCRQLHATTYVSGPSARRYLDEDLFRLAGVHVEWMDYAGYPEYPQLHPPFEHHVSILDLLFNVGERARAYMLSSPPDADA